MEEYCPGNEINKLKEEFWDHVMIGADVDKYTTRFHEFARLVPCTVTSESMRIECYIRGLAFAIRGNNGNQARDSTFDIENNKIICGYGLELECHTFIIDSIPFGHGSFDVNVGIVWLSRPRAKIVCYEKIVQIPLSNRENLEVHGERPGGNLKKLKTMKVNEPKLEDIPAVRDFPGVFLEDLSGLPPSREVEFRIDLIPGAMPVAKSPYHLVPTKMQELSNQLKEIQDKVEMLKGMDKQLREKKVVELYLAERIWVPVYYNLRTLIMGEDHTTKYYFHPRANTMNYDLRYLYWWPRMKKDIASYVAVREDYKRENLARLYINEIVARHSAPMSNISDHDSHFTSRFWQSLQKALGMQLDLTTTYHPQTDGQSERTIQTLEDMIKACAINIVRN
nr:putative reverse transcriptase domain-containing protein [Tanacetum cinerariifolium]GEY56432.1 putative reverse transcriptase domain-containing protein [Tanacetum cinerariifolium]